MSETHIFYSPHPDDETIGMAGHIAMAAAAGHQVIVVLVTPGSMSNRAKRLYGGKLRCPVHGVSHVAREEHVHASRWLEMVGACGKLGVMPPERMNLSEEDPDLRDKFIGHMNAYELRYPGAVHHTVMGPADQNIAGISSGTHDALWRGAMTFSRAGRRVMFHAIYVYGLPAEDRCLTGEPVALPPKIYEIKQQACAQYRIWNPSHHRFAYGYHSVPELFDAVESDHFEYVSEK